MIKFSVYFSLLFLYSKEKKKKTKKTFFLQNLYHNKASFLLIIQVNIYVYLIYSFTHNFDFYAHNKILVFTKTIGAAT